MTYLEELKELGANFKREKSTGSYIATYKEHKMEIDRDYDGNGVYYNIYKNGMYEEGDGGKDMTIRLAKKIFLSLIKYNH